MFRILAKVSQPTAKYYMVLFERYEKLPRKSTAYILTQLIEITSWKARAYGIFTRVGEVFEIKPE